MKLKSTQRIVALGALAIGAFGYAQNGYAAAVPTQMGEPTTINVTGTVENTVNITVTAPDLGVFSATGTVGGAADTATASFTPAGVVSNDTGAGPYTANSASLVWDPANQPVPGVVALAGGFGTQQVFVAYHTVSTLTDGASVIDIIGITDDLTTPTLYNNASGTPAITPGHGALVGGAMTWNIGMTLRTRGTELGEYPEGAYTGSFNMTMTY